MNVEDIQDKVIEKMTGVDKNRILQIRNGENPYGVPIVIILQVIAALIVIIPKILEWWKNRKNNLVARAYIFYVVKKQLVQDGKRDVSAISLSNAIYSTLKEME